MNKSWFEGENLWFRLHSGLKVPFIRQLQEQTHRFNDPGMKKAHLQQLLPKWGDVISDQTSSTSSELSQASLFALRALSQLVCLSWVLHRGQQLPPPTKKSFHCFWMLSQKASRWAHPRCQGALLQRRLDKQITLGQDIMNPDAVAWATAAHRLMDWKEQDPVMGFFISNLVGWIKHQRRLLWNVWIGEQDHRSRGLNSVFKVAGFNASAVSLSEYGETPRVGHVCLRWWPMVMAAAL